MKLKQYLKVFGFSREEFSELTEIPINTLAKYIQGKIPPLWVAMKIEKATLYNVTFEDYLNAEQLQQLEWIQEEAEVIEMERSCVLKDKKKGGKNNGKK